MLFIFIVIFLSKAHGFNSRDLKVQPKIVGGQAVHDLSLFAYQVSLQYKDRHICGGSIIDEYFILTAAHCFSNIKNIRNMRISLGGLNLHKDELSHHKLRKVFVHESFIGSTIENDIALIKLKSPIKISNTAKIVELQDSKLEPGADCVVSGWGVTDSEKPSDQLMATHVNIVPKRFCSIYVPIKRGMLCAGVFQGGKDACQGDSGGPLVCNNKLSGIVSWGIGCGEQYFPGVYTDVYYFRSWINETMENSSCGKAHVNSLIILFIFTLFKYIS